MESESHIPAGLDRYELKSSKVKEALAKVPRNEFVPEEVRPHALDDSALPIGLGQTISQPFIVGLMTQEADLSPGERVLEIGTGSGYQAAVLAELGVEVFSIEILPELSERATETLKRLGYDKLVHTKVGDGWEGWNSEAPFDAILITASCPAVPKILLKQLGPKGVLVFPLEMDHSTTLVAIRKNGPKREIKDLGPVRFVPLTGIGRPGN